MVEYRVGAGALEPIERDPAAIAPGVGQDHEIFFMSSVSLKSGQARQHPFNLPLCDFRAFGGPLKQLAVQRRGRAVFGSCRTGWHPVPRPQKAKLQSTGWKPVPLYMRPIGNIGAIRNCT